MSTSDEDSYSMIFTSLKHPIRRRILRILSNEQQGFSDLQKQFKIESSHLTYHIDGLGSLLFKTDDGRYGLSSLGEAAVSMMKNVEEPTGTSIHSFSKSTGKMPGWKLLSSILACGLIASLIFGGIILLRYNDLVSTNNKLNKAYGDLTNQINQLNQSYSELNRTFNQLNQTYSASMPHKLTFQTIEAYRFATTNNLTYYAIQNESSLIEMWNTTFRFQVVDITTNNSYWEFIPQMPNINFTESTVIAAFIGKDSNNEYGVRITEILDVSQYVIVKIEKTYIGNCVFFMGNPYSNQVIKTEKINKPILFYVNERTLEGCS
jgi:hypothetical protein